MLQENITELKNNLRDRKAPFGVDLLIPQVGGSARKTNFDYTNGQLNELVEVIIRNDAKLFVCAVGVPPAHVVQKLHEAKILIMSTTSGSDKLIADMVGHPKHVEKALAAGADIICAQGAEGGGHTGE